MLDLACGTGEFSNHFAQKGVSVIGVDISYDMLSVAREKTAEAGNDILYLCQDAAELDLYGTIDGAICCLDSLNHITDYEKFCKALERVSLF
jgi:ubiquinone/menaquinone biosynthesis C-methylase UbiE